MLRIVTVWQPGAVAGAARHRGAWPGNPGGWSGGSGGEAAMTWAALKLAGGPAGRGAKVVGGSFQAARVAGGVTFGVEEFLLLDPATGCAVLAAPELLQMLDGEPGVHHELMRFQVEAATPVCTSLEGAMSGFAARNACGDREEGTADQAARSVRCRADGVGCSWRHRVTARALRVFSCATYPPPKPQLRVAWEPLSAGGRGAARLPGLPVPALARDHPREPGGAGASEVAGLS